MSTPQLKKIHDQVLTNLAERTRGEGHQAKEMISQIFEEVERGRYTISQSVFILTTLGRYQNISPPQEDEIYRLLAKQISRTVQYRHLNLIEFLLYYSHDTTLNAMCFVMRSKWGLEGDKEGLRIQWRRLDSQKISSYFKRPRKKFLPRRMLRKRAA